MKARSSGILLDAVTLPPDSAIFQQFAARASLDARHTAAYRGLLNGLTTDGFFNADGTSSVFDFLYIFATQSSAIALLNIVSNKFNGTANGSPTFTADQGFTGVDNSTTVYIDTGFNATIGSPNFVQNSAHISIWSNTNAAAVLGGVTMGDSGNGLTAPFTGIHAEFSDNNAYYRINDNVASAGIAVTDSLGHYIATRSAANTQNGYKNAVDQGVVSQASAGVLNANMYVLASDQAGVGAGKGSALQISAASLGGALTANQALLFYRRLRTYMTAMGLS